MEELTQSQIKQAISLVKKYPENIGINILKIHMSIGMITANKLLEELENRKIISSKSENGRKLLI